MEIIAMPFIFIYHVVHYILLSPKRILNYAYSGILAVVDKLSRGKVTKRREEKAKEDSAILEVEAMMNESKINSKEKLVIDKEPLISFRYKVKGSSGKIINGTFEGPSADEVRLFLQNEGYEVIEVVPRKFYDIDINIGGKFTAADLSFSLTQLSTYLKAGIALIDSVRILEKQSEKAEQRKVYQKVVYELLKGQDLSAAMEKQGDKFPTLLVNMIKTAELTGDLTSVLDDMADYYTSKEETRKAMVSAMTYPVIVLCIAIGVIIFILISIVPQFVQMYEDNDAEIPAITTFVMNASDFIVNYYAFIIVGVVVFVGLFVYLYKKNKTFRKNVQLVLMHIPVFSQIIIYNEVYNFTKTFASLLNHGVFITDSMEVLSKITNNEIYKEIIARTIINLNKGVNISESFKGQWAFPVAAYEMIVTGEKTGQLGLMMEKVANYYQVLHKTLVKQMQSFIEPLMIAFLALIVGTILLSIVVPMFDIYGKIQ
ncbi:MAG TPA: type II secretion system F family protein [Candidatus Onthousia excrementipullorum]|uniref:Type II secretion system F family protein n=1 Tax=Candidatus Onthousia excrementipullorum TaxID=2840884 RepID=A0A9D1DU71_9FIRM|nr:type II secretion system F family protein [Candidatus Onthousia excrementipullorum]